MNDQFPGVPDDAISISGYSPDNLHLLLAYSKKNLPWRFNVGGSLLFRHNISIRKTLLVAAKAHCADVFEDISLKQLIAEWEGDQIVVKRA